MFNHDGSYKTKIFEPNPTKFNCMFCPFKDKKEEIGDFSQFPNNTFGFIYKITHIPSGKSYIGKNGKLPWPYHPEDMKWFRENTTGHVVVRKDSVTV